MKRFGIWFFIGMMLISLLSCSSLPEKEEPAVADTFVQSEPEQPINGPEDLRAGEQPDFEGAVLDWIDDEKVIRFPDQDFSPWESFYVDNTDAMIIDKYPDLMRQIGEDGLIVAARAYGERIGHIWSKYTTTKMRIEKVFYGKAPSKKIQVQEGYTPVMDYGKRYIVYTSHGSRLRDNQLVLLFLCKSESKETYHIAYYHFPLQKGYQDYSEEYLTELLDYYRGDRNQYRQGYQATYWPKKDLSNEEMLEELSDNILVQVAANHKVCLWPVGHIKYQNIDNYQSGKMGFDNWSYPLRNY